MAKKLKQGDHTTRLPPSSFRPVSFRYDTIKGNVPTFLATTSTTSGMPRLLLLIAFFGAGQEAIQSQLSAPSSLFTMNSFIDYGSRVPKTFNSVRWRQRLKGRKSNNGYSISFSWYPLPKNFTWASISACGHHTSIWTNCINDSSQHNQLLIHVAAEPIQNWHADQTKLAIVPAPNEHPDVLALLHKLFAAIAKRFCPSEYLAQITGVLKLRMID